MSATGHKGNLTKAAKPLQDLIEFVASLDLDDLAEKNPGVPMTLAALEDLRIRLRDGYSLFLKRIKNGELAAILIEDLVKREKFLTNFRTAVEKHDPRKLEADYCAASTKLQGFRNQVDGAGPLAIVEPLADLRNEDSVFGDEENPILLDSDDENYTTPPREPKEEDPLQRADSPLSDTSSASSHNNTLQDHTTDEPPLGIPRTDQPSTSAEQFSRREQVRSWSADKRRNTTPFPKPLIEQPDPWAIPQFNFAAPSVKRGRTTQPGYVSGPIQRMGDLTAAPSDSTRTPRSPTQQPHSSSSQQTNTSRNNGTAAPTTSGFTLPQRNTLFQPTTAPSVPSNPTGTLPSAPSNSTGTFPSVSSNSTRTLPSASSSSTGTVHPASSHSTRITHSVQPTAAPPPPQSSSAEAQMMQLLIAQLAALQRQSDQQAMDAQLRQADLIIMQRNQANQAAESQRQQTEMMAKIARSLTEVSQKVDNNLQPSAINQQPTIPSAPQQLPSVAQQSSYAPQQTASTPTYQQPPSVTNPSIAATPKPEDIGSKPDHGNLTGLEQLNALITRNTILEPITIPLFDGNPEDYKDWWNTFVFAVHESSMSVKEKMTRLKKSTTGQVAALISAFSDDTSNYDLCVAMIKENFDSHIDATQRIMLRLQNLKPSGSTPAELRATYIAVFSNAMALMKQEPSDKSSPLFNIIMAKFPSNIQFRVSRLRKKVGTEWTIAAVLSEINEMITLEEYNQCLYKPQAPSLVSLPFTTSSVSRSKSPGRFSHSPHRGRSQERRSFQRNPSDNTPSSSSSANSMKCEFCELTNHHATTCRKIDSPEERLAIVRSKNLCFICLSANHLSMDCKENNCSSCGRRHHVTLCGAQRSRSSSTPRYQRGRSPGREVEYRSSSTSRYQRGRSPGREVGSSNSNRVHNDKKNDYPRDNSRQRASSRPPFRAIETKDKQT